jgi:thiosulfate/3-mercaptopyruvate sulfurtransferase
MEVFAVKKQKGSRIVILAFMMGIMMTAGGELAADDHYNYLVPDAAKEMIKSGQAMVLLDIQVKDEYDRHHIKGSVATYAYPVKSDEERARIDGIIPDLATTTDPVVIICPRGGGGARRTFEYLASKGIADERMFILENGQSGWPYPELIESN